MIDSEAQVLETFTRFYLCRIAVKWLNIGNIIVYLGTVEKQESFIRKNLDSDLEQLYPPLPEYKVRVLKSIVEKLEDSGVEVSGRLYEMITTACQSTLTHHFNEHPSKPTTFHRIFLLPNDKSGVVEENTLQLSLGTTGLSSWQGAYYLSSFMYKNRKNFEGKDVLELGAGIGLTACSTIQLLEPAEYVVSDCNPIVLHRAASNLAKTFQLDNIPEFDRNQSVLCNKTVVRLELLDWNRTDFNKIRHKHDFIIGADLIFEPESICPIICVVSNLLEGNPSSVFYLVHTIRNKSTAQKLDEALADSCLEVMDKMDYEMGSLDQQILPFGPTVACASIIYTIKLGVTCD